MAIKKTAKMSAAPKKFVAKKSDPGKGKMTASQVKADMKKRASKPNPKADQIVARKKGLQEKMTSAVRRAVKYNESTKRDDYRYSPPKNLYEEAYKAKK